jgi:hypothetical protein
VPENVSVSIARCARSHAEMPRPCGDDPRSRILDDLSRTLISIAGWLGLKRAMQVLQSRCYAGKGHWPSWSPDDHHNQAVLSSRWLDLRTHAPVRPDFTCATVERSACLLPVHNAEGLLLDLEHHVAKLQQEYRGERFKVGGWAEQTRRIRCAVALCSSACHVSSEYEVVPAAAAAVVCCRSTPHRAAVGTCGEASHASRTCDGVIRTRMPAGSGPQATLRSSAPAPRNRRC